MELREFLWLIPSAFILSCSILLSILFFTIKSKNRKANIYLGKTFSPKIKFLSPLDKEMKHFLECINKKKQPITSADYSLKVMEILENIQKKTI